MKKIGILLAILLVAGAYAMADETAAAQGELFADVGAAALSQAEMDAVEGDGAWTAFGAVMAADWVVEKATGKSPVREVVKATRKSTREWAEKPSHRERKFDRGGAK